jgi:hypothetical protein
MQVLRLVHERRVIARNHNLPDTGLTVFIAWRHILKQSLATI